MSAIVEYNAEEDRQLIDVMESTLYPGAKPASIYLVLHACRAADLDPMTKPYHIVNMSVKGADGQYTRRDVIMPGIDQYRTKAARTNEYVGCTAPEFGPTITRKLDNGDEFQYPEWCRITVRRLKQGHIAEFPAEERWSENYATAGRDTNQPNEMWRKRPFAQLAKCAEAQALRRGFPEATGAAPTMEEMVGKVIDNSQDYIDVDPQTGEVTNIQADDDLADKLEPVDAAPPTESQQVPKKETAPAPAAIPPDDTSSQSSLQMGDSPAAPVSAPEGDVSGGGSTPEQQITEAIGVIETPDDANDVQDIINTSQTLTSDEKMHLRRAINAKMKDINAARTQ